MSLDTSQLKPWLRELLNSCPAAGSGVHRWHYKVARQLHAHFDREDIFTLLQNGSAQCGRPVLESEIVDAINDSAEDAWMPNWDAKSGTAVLVRKESKPKTTALADPDLDAIDRIVREVGHLADLCERSTVQLSDGVHAEFIIDTLFPGNPFLCVGKPLIAPSGKRGYESHTRPRDAWYGQLSKWPLVVPNPMLGPTGYTKAGKPSERSLEAVADWVYFVTEFDFAEKARDGKKDTVFAPLVRAWTRDNITISDACAALILHLAIAFGRLVCVCFSGGKSLHAWWRVLGLSPVAREAFFDKSAELGADPATRTLNQLVRIPDGLRENGVRQTCYYLDPKEAVTLNE